MAIVNITKQQVNTSVFINPPRVSGFSIKTPGKAYCQRNVRSKTPMIMLLPQLIISNPIILNPVLEVNIHTIYK